MKTRLFFLLMHASNMMNPFPAASQTTRQRRELKHPVHNGARRITLARIKISNRAKGKLFCY